MRFVLQFHNLLIYVLLSAALITALLANPAVLLAGIGIVVLQVLFVNLPLFQNVFGTAAIPPSDWIMLLFFTATVFVLVEAEKIIFRRMEKRKRMLAGRNL